MCLMQVNCTQNMLQFWNMYNFVVVTPGTYSLHNVKSSVYSTEWIKSIVIEFLLFIQFLNLSLLCLHPKKRNQLLNLFSILISDIFWNRPIIKAKYRHASYKADYPVFFSIHFKSILIVNLPCINFTFKYGKSLKRRAVDELELYILFYPPSLSLN